MNKILSKNHLYNIAIALVIAIFFSVDRFLKLAAWNSRAALPYYLVGKIFSFRFTANSYMAFSLPFGGMLLNASILIIIALLVSYVAFLIIHRPNQRLEIICFSLILSGAISNVLDRFIYGYVIDYWSLRYFTIFNLADVMISVGALVLIIKNLKK